MDLAQALAAKPPQGGGSPIDLTKESRRAWKMLVHGPYKGGKTTFAISVVEWLVSQGLKPEQVLFVLIDCDDGFLPLVEKGLLPKEWYPCVKGRICSNFKEVKEVTAEWLPKLQEWQQKHGVYSAWLVVDNMRAQWSWVRDEFSQQVYGKREFELLEQRRLEAMDAGKRTLPTYNQQFDYGAINAMHDAWAERIKLSGVNFLWLAPTDEVTLNRGEDDEQKMEKPGGQKHNPGRVDWVVKTYKDGDKHWLDLEQTRIAPSLFRRMPEPSFLKLANWAAAQKVKK